MIGAKTLAPCHRVLKLNKFTIIVHWNEWPVRFAHITQPHSEVYCRYFHRLVFGNSLTFSHIEILPPCFHAEPPDFLRLIGPRGHVCSETFC